MKYIFVYGVFRDANIDSLGEAVYCDTCFVNGRIYQVNDFYPGFKRINCDNRVYGDVYLVDESIFTLLDEFEGDEYVRKLIWTSIGEEAWIYEYLGSVDNFKEIKGGDWLLR